MDGLFSRSGRIDICGRFACRGRLETDRTAKIAARREIRILQKVRIAYAERANDVQ